MRFRSLMGEKSRAMDHEIQETVEAILGKDVKVIDCEKKSSIKEEEVLLVNGYPVTLDGEDGVAIKDALLRGDIPNCQSLNQILVRVGILKAPVKLETNLSVKSNVVTREEVTVARGGQVVDERSRETKEDNFYTSKTSEIWEPVGILTKENPAAAGPRESEFVSFTSTPKYLRSERSAGAPHSSESDARRSRNASHSVNKDETDSNSQKLKETKISSVLKKFTSEVDDQTDFVHSKQTMAGVTPKSTGLHALSISNAVKENCLANNSSDLIYRDGILHSGTLESLIRLMVPSVDYYPDRKFLFAFLLTSRLFIEPRDLLRTVISICDSQQHFSSKTPQNKESLLEFIPQLIRLMRDWTESFPYDFRDNKIMAHVRSLTQKCVNVNPDLLPEVSTLLRNLLQNLTNLDHYEEFLQEVNQNSVKHSVDLLSPTNCMELCPDAKVLAEHLCHIELERLSFIGPEEFVQAFAQENASSKAVTKDTKKTRNLEAYVQWFNRLSYLVGSEICKHMKKKVRVKTIEYWVEVARESFNIGNFNSLMAIIAGLNLSPVARLKKTWAKVQLAKFSILEHQMNPSSNFSSYRSTLKAAMWRSTGDNMRHQCVVIPFFSLLIKDIYFINEGCVNKLSNGHINFEKFWQLSQQIGEFIEWQRTNCSFEKDLRIITFLQASPVLSERALSLASFECEPPDTSSEKEQCKSLKNSEG